jgi:thioredoxin 1
MKKMIRVFLLVLVVGIVSCSNPGQATGGASQQNVINNKISVDEFAAKLASSKEAQLVDVRTEEEYAEGHLNRSLNIDIRSADFDVKIGKLDKAKPVFVYCRSGGRSSSAAEKLVELGFTEIYNMDGGITKWESAGKPVEK